MHISCHYLISTHAQIWQSITHLPVISPMHIYNISQRNARAMHSHAERSLSISLKSRTAVIVGNVKTLRLLGRSRVTVFPRPPLRNAAKTQDVCAACVRKKTGSLTRPIVRRANNAGKKRLKKSFSGARRRAPSSSRLFCGAEREGRTNGVCFTFADNARAPWPGVRAMFGLCTHADGCTVSTPIYALDVRALV